MFSSVMYEELLSFALCVNIVCVCVCIRECELCITYLIREYRFSAFALNVNIAFICVNVFR